MKPIALLALLALLTGSCKNRKNLPDVSAIPVTIRIERFDQAFFALDSNNMKQGLYQLNQTYSYFTEDFVVNILGVGPLNDTSEQAFAACRQFLTTYLPVKDSLAPVFSSMKKIEGELQDGFKYLKYYFPKYSLPPKIVAYIGPFDAPAVAITRYALAIGLQLFAGRNFSFYKSMEGQEMYPAYISRRFEPDYVAPNCMKAILEDLRPDNSAGRPLIEQMVEKGKYWWLLDQVMPETADSLKTGYTAKQLNWCAVNEGLIWNFFLQNDLYTIDPEIIKNYIGEGPSTQGMPDASPGNIGQWVGWQIVKKYVASNPSLTPLDILNTPAKKIFEDAKYKPR